LIILNPSTLTFFLDRLFSSQFKMIKVGIVRTRNVIIGFHSFALGAPPLEQDRYLVRRPTAALGLGGNSRAIELEGISAAATTDSVRLQIRGHASGIPSLLLPIRKSRWKLLPVSEPAEFPPHCTACIAGCLRRGLRPTRDLPGCTSTRINYGAQT
jgi:hypothetical protein